MCQNVLFLFGGYNSELNDAVSCLRHLEPISFTRILQSFQSKMPLILKHTPAGSSAAQIIHYGQLMRTSRFRKFDHGAIRNLQLYGSLLPPEYRLHRVTAPVALHYGHNDLLAAVEDIHRLGAKLSNVLGYFPVAHPRFNHFDFLWARNVRDLLYKRVVALMKTAEDNEQ